MGLLYKFFSETTIHGLCHIAKEKPVVFRLLWFAVFLAGLGATSVWYYNAIALYLTNPTSTEFSVIKEGNYSFPRLMICSTNRFNGTTVRQLNISDALMSVFHRDMTFTFPTAVMPDLPVYATLLNQTFPEYQQLKQKLQPIRHHREIIDHLSPKCEDIVLECLIAPFAATSCCAQAVMYDFMNMPCVLLPRYQMIAGMDPMIMFMLKYPNASELSPSQTSAFFGDHVVFVLRDDDIHDFDTGGAAARGKYTKIFIEKIQHISVNNPPKFECIDKKNYSQFSCVFECQVKTLLKPTDISSMESISCSNHAAIPRKIGDPQPTCDPWQNYEYYPSLYSSSVGETTELIEECLKKCLPPCELHRHKYRYIYVSEFPTDAMHKFWKDPAKARDIIDTRGILIVSGNAEAEIIHQKFSMTVTALVGNLGGSLGLFLGGSIASLVHVIIYILENAVRRKE